MTAPTADEVGGRTRRGISWSLVGAAVTNVMRMVSVAVLARMLEPHDFGIVAAAISVMIVLHQVRDLGVAVALVQREDLDRGHVATAFAFSLYLGVVMGGALALSAPWIGSLYGIVESVDVIRVLGLLFVLRGISAVPLTLCRRAMNFRAIAIVDTTTYAAGSVTAMTLAVSGAGPWSLVAGYVVEESLSAALYLYLQPAFSLRIERQKLRDLLGFGIGQTLYQLAAMLATQGDNFVVGRSLGATQLGYYSRAYELIKLPASVYNNVVGNVLWPAFSRLQNDRVRLVAAYRRATLANALVLLPGSAVLIVIAPEAIDVVMGGQWDAAILPFRILALTMFMRTSYKVGAAVAQATGSVYAVAVANVIYMVCVIAGAALVIPWGIPAVAATTALSIGVVYVHCSYLAMRASSMRAGELILAHAPGLVLAGAAGLVTWIATNALRSAGAAPAVTFAAIGVLGIVVVIAGVAVWMRGSSSDSAWLREEILRIRARLSRRRA